MVPTAVPSFFQLIVENTFDIVELSTIPATLYRRILLYNGYNLSRGSAMFFPHRLREFLRMRNGVQHRRLSWSLKTRPVLEEE